MLRILASSASRVRLRLGSRELGPTACLSLFLLLASASVECMFDSSLSLVLLLGIHLPDCSSSRSGNANPVVLCCRCHCTMVFHALSLTRSFQKGRKGAREQGRQSGRERRSYSNFRCFCCILIPVSLLHAMDQNISSSLLKIPRASLSRRHWLPFRSRCLTRWLA